MFFDLIRKLSPEERMVRVFGMVDFLRRFVAAGIKRQYPNATDHEIKMRMASRMLDRETMIRAYGWDPEAHD